MDRELTVEVEAIKAVADGVREITLSAADGSRLPAWAPGAHIDVILGDGLARQYSLCGDITDPTSYRIAVLWDRAGRGGSRYVHEKLRVGEQLVIRTPRNHFSLNDAPSYLFVAGGIGITPLMPMVRQVVRTGRPAQVVYVGRSRTTMAYAEEVERLGGLVTATEDNGRPDLRGLLERQPAGTAVYCCGPESLLDTVESVCALRSEWRVHVEHFTPKTVADGPSQPFVAELANSGLTLHVPADRRLVDVLLDAGIDILTSCEEGICGTCETRVLAGVPDHRDSVLTDEEQESGDCMMVCVSRSRTPSITLQL